MKLSKLLFWLLLPIGEAIIVTCFLLFSKLPTNITVLNICVSSVVYLMMFIGIKPGWIDLNDKSQKQVGGLGISWTAFTLYSIAAVAVMLLANLSFRWGFSLQLIIQIILVFFLAISLFWQGLANNKVEEVYNQETALKAGVAEIKKAIKSLKDNISITPGLPQDFVKKIDEINEEITYLRPSNNDDAASAEESILNHIHEIEIMINNFQLNENNINLVVQKLEIAVNNRKHLLSR